MNSHEFMLQVMIFLTSAIILVPVAQRLKLGSVLGYLAAGVIIGPSVLGLVSDVKVILHFAELGVVFFLFLIGLELNPSSLWTMRKAILATGLSQVLVTTIVLWALLTFCLNLSTYESLVLAMGLSLSSTAIALQILGESHSLATPAGKSAFAVLLFQDIAVIPMLAVVGLISGSGQSGGNAWLDAAKALLVIVCIVGAGRFVVRPVFRLIAASGVREVFTAFSLFLVVGIALLMESVGLSMALGTFIAGVILADSEYRHELEIDIEPFKGLLLGLFFIAIGMTVDVGFVLAQPLLVLSLVAGLLTIKAGILFTIGRVSQLNLPQNFHFSFLLAQGGEFAFVLFNLAGEKAVVSKETGGIAVLVVAISMALTPLLMIINSALIQPRFARSKERDMDEITPEEDAHTIICGFGRFGQMVGRFLSSQGLKATVLDHDPSNIETLRRFGFKVFYGDASRLDLLESAGAETARAIVVATDDPETNIKISKMVRAKFPKAELFIRSRSRTDAHELIDEGFTHVFRETFYSATEVGAAVLQSFGIGAFQARQRMLRFQHYDRRMVREMAGKHRDQKQLVSAATEARQTLEKTMANDLVRLEKDDSWN